MGTPSSFGSFSGRPARNTGKFKELQKLDTTCFWCLDINFKPYNNKWNLCECIFSADCSWDYFTCTKRYGRWPMNKRCCNKRFDMCCKMMMKKKKNTRPLYQIPIRTTTKSPSGVSALSPVGTSQKPPESTTTNPDKIQMSKCLFMYL